MAMWLWTLKAVLGAPRRAGSETSACFCATKETMCRSTQERLYVCGTKIRAR